jgi:tetratricopeptide (TPR) repeat protein
LPFYPGQGKTIALMSKYLPALLVFLLVGTAGAQDSTKGAEAKLAEVKPSETKADYSKEAFIDEQDSTKIVAENDGTSTRLTSTRVRIQSDAGVQRFGVLTLSYQNAIENITIDYVRVQKPDGTTIVTPADSVQDMPAEITRQAPFYSDLREKHVAVKGLSVGDVLEYQVRWQTTKPLAPGQFWFSFNAPHDFIVLRWELQISLPRDRAVKWKSASLKPTVTEEGGRRIFDWTVSQLEHESTEQQKKDQDEKLYQASRGRMPQPDVQISTFQSWEEVGAWYNALQQERVKPTAEIRSKAAELTKNAADENAKLHTIYNYVSTQFRYIGVAFGIGRYQPHSAAEVLANQYGDCKDKHTLLASLLEAAGIKAYPALISATRELDPDVPSPAQFDHVITAVPQGTGLVWLDTTTEVAPYGYLLSLLRDKQALLMPIGKSASLVTVPADPPTKSVQTFRIDAKLKEDGTLEGKIERSLSGDDAEVLVRAGFRRLPMPQWKDLVQQISYASGFSGDVSEVTASPPEKTDEPFHFSYKYTRKDFPDWSNRRVATALPPLDFPMQDTKPSHPIWLGSPEEVHLESRVELPKGYNPQLPAKVDLVEQFAEYHASYKMKDGALQVERRASVKLREVPVDDFETYKKFRKAIDEDFQIYVAVYTGGSTPDSYQAAIWSLPDSDNPEAARAYTNAANQVTTDVAAAIQSLTRAVDLDPKFTRAWLWLGQLYIFRKQNDLAIQAFRKGVEASPQQPLAYKVLGTSLLFMQKQEEALEVWRKLSSMVPDDPDGPAGLGAALVGLKRYKEAVSAIETAIKLAPDRAGLYFQLGLACLHAENEPGAVDALKKAVEIDSSPLMLNNIGYELADSNKQLPLSLEYAQKAVRGEEEASAKVKLSDLKNEDLRYTPALAAYWDSLGWVYFRMAMYQQAEKYLSAAWQLSQDPTVGDHLGQVYEQQHKKEQAIHVYRLVLAASRTPGQMKETQTRLEKLGGAKIGRFGDELSQLRTLKLQSMKSDSGSAEFFLLFGSGAKVEEVKFISGSEKLKSAEKDLSAATFNVQFPDDGPTRLLRRGILSCSSVSGCSFVLYTPDMVRSVN